MGVKSGWIRGGSGVDQGGGSGVDQGGSGWIRVDQAWQIMRGGQNVHAKRRGLHAGRVPSGGGNGAFYNKRKETASL